MPDFERQIELVFHSAPFFGAGGGSKITTAYVALNWHTTDTDGRVIVTTD